MFWIIWGAVVVLFVGAVLFIILRTLPRIRLKKQKILVTMSYDLYYRLLEHLAEEYSGDKETEEVPRKPYPINFLDQIVLAMSRHEKEVELRENYYIREDKRLEV